MRRDRARFRVCRPLCYLYYLDDVEVFLVADWSTLPDDDPVTITTFLTFIVGKELFTLSNILKEKRIHNEF